MIVFILKVLFKSIFLLLLSEPTIDVFKTLKREFAQYRVCDDENEKKSLKKKVISHGLGFLLMFAIYCVLVINLMDWLNVCKCNNMNDH